MPSLLSKLHFSQPVVPNLFYAMRGERATLHNTVQYMLLQSGSVRLYNLLL